MRYFLLSVLITASVFPVQAADPQAAAVSDTSPSKANAAEREFELLVVGPNKEPLGNSPIEVRGKFDAASITVGTVVRAGRYNSVVRTDSAGRLVASFPNNPQPRFKILIAGYGPYWLQWRSQARPATFTAVLDPAITVGGVIVDEQGAPVQDAQIRASIPYKMRPGDTQSLSGQSVASDDLGRWSFSTLPRGVDSFFVEITHPAFAPTRTSLSAEVFAENDKGELPERVVMKKGITVVGRITDPNDRPVANALVRTKFLNDVRECRTDQLGRYELVGCEPVPARIVVSAPGLALDMKEIRISENQEPIDFKMQPGGHLRVRVTTKNGEPLPRTGVFFQKWRGSRIEYFEFDHLDDPHTDENGVWEWNEAPVDEVHVDINPPAGRMSLSDQVLFSREQEFVFSPPPQLVIVGKVIDANTKEPIKAFRVVPGVRGSPQRRNWVPSQIFEATDGQFELRRSHGYLAHMVKIEARGYLAAESREIASDEGRVEITLALKKGDDIDLRVMTPAGAPAVGAEVGLGIADSSMHIVNGEFDNGSTRAQRDVVNNVGRFRFPPPGGPFQIVITHELGFAHIKSDGVDYPHIVRLIPWARAEGTFRIAGQPQSGVNLYLNSGTVYSGGRNQPSIYTSHETVTGKDGRFVFNKVFPGNGRVARSILRVVDEGAREVTSSTSIAAEFPSGQTTTIEFGQTGRQVIGKLLPPKDFSGKALWSFADVTIRSDPGPPPPPVPPELNEQPAKRAEWMQKWLQTDAGNQWKQANTEARKHLRQATSYSATVDSDGEFQVHDVQPGNYVFSVRFWQNTMGQITDYRFELPEPEGSDPRAAYRLEDLQLEP